MVGSTIIAIFVRRIRLASGFWGATPILWSSTFFSLACFSAAAIAASEGAVSASIGAVAGGPAAPGANAALSVPRSLETVPQAASTRLAANAMALASMAVPAVKGTMTQPGREFKRNRLHGGFPAA